MHIDGADIALIGTLILLEGLLSADNALVMAVMVLGLPEQDRKKALSYGLIGGFIFRVIATLLAVYLMKVLWVKVAGGLYLLYLVYQHFFRHNDDPGGRNAPPKAQPAFGLSALWATIAKVELMNLAFSIDSILVAVGLSNKTWVVMTGGILGIVAMRLVVGQLMQMVEKYPALVDGAFIIISWVAFKLIADYAHEVEWIHWKVPQDVSLFVIFGIFGLAYIYARKRGPRGSTSAD